MTEWQTIAARRFPGYSVEGDGRFALVMEDHHAIQLSAFAFDLSVPPGYEAYRKIVELKPVLRKVNTPRRSTSDPSKMEKD